MSMHEVLSCSGLVVQAGGRVLARDVAMAVGQGEFHVLTGRSGTGKSTLLWTLAGLLRAGGGIVEVCGQRVDARRTSSAAGVRRRHLGIVYQQPNLLADLTVVENVAVPLMLAAGTERAEAQARSEDLVRALGIDPTTDTRALSGGEQQRVAVARALVGRPELVLADEPTASLDPESGDLVMDALEGLCREQGTGLLVASHDPAVVARATYQWVLADEAVHGPTVRASASR